MIKINGGEIVVKSLEIQGVERIFCIPGESFLPILDALQNSKIDTVLARHEGGAAMMAEADGKLTGRPGIVLVTRGPGATNASAGIHIAQQDSTPLIMLVGQVSRDMRGRDAFQEINLKQMFSGMCKYVEEIEDISNLNQAIAEAFKISMEGRPGPVVLSLPQDMLYDTLDSIIFSSRIKIHHPSPSSDEIFNIKSLLTKSKEPIVIAGGSLWDIETIHKLEDFAAAYKIPIVSSFRRQSIINNLSPYYAGDLGLGCNPALINRIKTADLLILIGGRLSEIPSQSYTLLNIPIPQMPFIHIYADPKELRKIYKPDLAICSAPYGFLTKMLKGVTIPQENFELPEHKTYRKWTENIPFSPGKVNLGEIISFLRVKLPSDSIITNGAGNYATWIHRYYHFRYPKSQLAPTSGSMGYGIPAAVAAKVRFPDRTVVAFAGDGCFQMTMQEMATAKQISAHILVILVDNGMYGTIRMHQEINYPGRTLHTDLANPNFSMIAEGMGFHAEKVDETYQFIKAFKNCIDSGKPGFIHIKIDKDAISPDKTLSDFRLSNKN